LDASLPSVFLDRVITVEDFPWILTLAHKRYTDKPDPGATLVWLANVLRWPNAYAIRSEGAFCVALIQVPPWYPEHLECHISVLVADQGCIWQAVRLLRDTVRWAKGRGCKRWWLTSDTDKDFNSLARRVGASVEERYLIDLTDGQ